MKELISILKTKRVFLLILALLLLAITFETSQQLYYVRRFNLSDDATFLGILKSQAFSWVLWMLLSGFIVLYIKRSTNKHSISITSILSYITLIIGLVLLNILIISTKQILLGNDTLTFTNLFAEYVPFYIFQKAPIYTLGYIAIFIITHLYFTNEQLQIDVQDLAELKKSNLKLYNQLHEKIDKGASILNIKIGNKRKIIPVSEILWIEADDYCVKVHTSQEHAYSMRSSLKALNEKLGNNFIRVHRKAIVNMNMVKEFNLSEKPSLVLTGSVKVPVSKSCLKVVRNFIS